MKYLKLYEDIKKLNDGRSVAMGGLAKTEIKSLNEEQKFSLIVKEKNSKKITKYLNVMGAHYSGKSTSGNNVEFEFGDSGSVTAFSWAELAVKYLNKNRIDFEYGSGF